MKSLEYALKRIRENAGRVNGSICQSLRKNYGTTDCEGCILKETFEECSNHNENKVCGDYGVDWEGMFAKAFRKKKLEKLLEYK